MKALTVDFDLISQSMRDLSRENDDFFMNRYTGKVITLSRELLKSLSEECERGKETVPDWDAKLIPIAREIVIKGSTDYVRIPEAFGSPEHKWMTEFAKDMRGDKLKQKLLQALRGRGACKRFKDILKEYPDDMRRWTMFIVRCWQEKIQAWLESLSIIAIEKNPRKPRATAR